MKSTLEAHGAQSTQQGFKARHGLAPMLLAILTASSAALSQTTVDSPRELLDYLDDDNVHVQLSPGVYSIGAADVTNGTYGNPIFRVSGNNSTYDFTGVTIQFSTDLLQASGREDVYQIQILGNHNVLKNLTMVDVGSKTDRPTWRATNVVMDGSHNRVEGFHMTVKGSWPYGYGDAFGKGGSHVIRHYKHCGLLVRGESNHVKNCTMIHRAYGHGIYMQAANNALIEGCHVEGELRSTDDMLAEEGTGSPADKVNFKTVWGYRLPAGFVMSLQEGGIRAYNGGDTMIDGKEYERGASNVTVLNCTVKHMRTGVTLTHATGKKYVENSTTIGCERGFCIGTGDIVNCRGDALYGPVFGVDYESDRNCNADITVLPSHGGHNGNNQLASIIGRDHKITLRSSEATPDPSLTIDLSGTYDVVRSRDARTKAARNVEIHNLTQYPLVLGSKSSRTTGESRGAITDEGSGNAVAKMEHSAPAKDAPGYDASVPKPTRSGISYGEHGRQILDFWKAEAEGPTPLVLVIHGGGWRGGEKERVHRFVNVQQLLDAGISVVAINYRLIRHAEEAGIEPPVKAPLYDAARALQFVRSKANEWNLDKRRIGAAGGSAGACSSLWLAYRDDLADPSRKDGVAGESTRLWCAAVTRPQTSLDPQQITEWIPNCKYGAHAFGKESFEQFLAERDGILPWIAEYSPYTLVSADDPSVYLFYTNPPALGETRKDPVHSSNFGVKLQERCAAVGIGCEVQYPGAVDATHKTATDYLITTLSAPTEPGARN